MRDYDKILELADDKTLKLTNELKELLGTELYLGMSNYVCEHGTLSEGFEKITDAQRYYQAVKECYSYNDSIMETKASAMKAQANFQLYKVLDTLFGWMPIVGLYTKSNLMTATNRIKGLLITIEDQLRILKAFNKVREELLPKVRAQYKNIEEAEPDNWAAVLKYRMARQKIGKPEFLNHVPMPKEQKADLGLKYGAPEAVMWLAIEKEEDINKGFNGDIKRYLESGSESCLKIMP